MIIYSVIGIMCTILIIFDIMANLPGRRIISVISFVVALVLASVYFTWHKAMIESFVSGKAILCSKSESAFVITNNGYVHKGGYFINTKGEAIDEEYCKALE